MRVAGFYHSLESDWNHGNAHFLRGIATELTARGHAVQIYEPRDSWSRENLTREYGEQPIADFHRYYPALRGDRYDAHAPGLEAKLDGVDLVLVHEWNEPGLVRMIGEHHRRNGGYVLLFHDTHHRSVTDPDSMSRYDLSDYDGVLAYGEAIKEIYVKRGWARQVWTWHEAADTRVFRPFPESPKEGDLVWIGNWGDDERTAELREFLFEPVSAMGLRAQVYGVRYPQHGLEMLRGHGIGFGGWLPNYRAPETFARFRVTVHVPRRPYARALRGIPTIRPFEALACGIPLVSAPWEDSEGLFSEGRDYLRARNGAEMRKHLRSILSDPDFARGLAEHGRRTILARHSCLQRVNELLSIVKQISCSSASEELTMEHA